MQVFKLFSCKMVVKPKKLKFILKTCLFLTLLVCFTYFYLLEIAKLYFKESTTFSTTRVHAEKSILPSISFCIDRGLKPNVLHQHTGSSQRGVFLGIEGKKPTKALNVSLADLYDLATYKINRDFTVNIAGTDLVVGNNLVRNNNKIIEVKEFATMTHGICYSVIATSKLNHKTRLSITPIGNEDLRGVIFFLTTPNKVHNIIIDKYPYVQPLIFHSEFSQIFKDKIFLRETKWKFFKGNPNCLNGCPLESCITWNDFAQNCTTLCIPIVLSSMYADIHLPYCETIQENICMIKQFNQVLDETFASCPPPEYDTQYEANILTDEYLLAKTNSSKK